MNVPEKKVVTNKPSSFKEEIISSSSSFEEELKTNLVPKTIVEKIEKKEILEEKTLPINNLSNETMNIPKNQIKKSLFNENIEIEKSTVQEKNVKKLESIPQQKRPSIDIGISQSLVDPSFMNRKQNEGVNDSKMKELEEKKRQLEIRKREIEEKRKNLQQYSTPGNKKETKLEEVKFLDSKTEEKVIEKKLDPPKQEEVKMIEKKIEEMIEKVEMNEKKPIEISETKNEEEEQSKTKKIEEIKPINENIKISLKNEDSSSEEEEFQSKERHVEIKTPEESFEVKDDEVANILNEFSTPNVKRKQKLILENHKDVQKNALFNTKKMINIMLNYDVFDANLDVELELLSKRLENLEERSYYLQNNKKRFKDLDIEDIRGYESSYDNLMRISIISERIKYREERLKLTEKLFQLEWKHESESSKLFSKSNFKKSKRKDIPQLNIEEEKSDKKESEDYITPRDTLSKNGRVSIDSTKLKEDEDENKSIRQKEDDDTNDTISEAIDEKKTPKQIETKIEDAKLIQSPQGISGRHMKLYVDIPQNVSKSKQMQSQEGKCAGCDIILKDTIFNRPRFCYYTYKYYCNDCHRNDLSYIPFMVLHQWDFRENYVCVMAKNYLEQIYPIPMICISAINPSLFDKVPNLNKSRMIRKRLNIQWDIINDCENKDSLFETLKLDNYSNYLTNTEIYSILNLEQLNRSAQNSPFLKKLSKLFSLLSDHITQNCKYCKKKAGRICSVCYDPTPIYAFNISTVNQCPNCQLVYHKDCFKTKSGVTGCPNCSNEK